MQFITAASIALLAALVAGAVVWIAWSVAENIVAARRAKHDEPAEAGHDAKQPE